MVREVSLLSVLMCLIWTHAAFADVPHRLHYNGYLTNAVGEAIDCPDPIQCTMSYDLTFRLYNEADDSAFVWDETHTDVAIFGGSVHVTLGSVTPLSAELMDGSLWLAIKVNDNAEMDPRQEIVSAAYAIRSGHADQANEAVNATQLNGASATDYASATDLAAVEANLANIDTNTQLTEAEVDGFVANNGYSMGDHTIDTNTQLTEAEVDGFVANNGYSMGDHTVDTNTQLTEAEVDGFVANNGYSMGDHTVDTNTQLTEAEVDAYVANNNYSMGAHTVDTDTQLTEAEVDAFVANNGFAQNTALLSLETDVAALSPSQWTGETGYIRPNNTPTVAIRDTGQVGIGTTNPAQTLDVAGSIKFGSSDTCNVSTAGSMRWTGSSFEGCDGSAWVAFATGGGGPPSGTVIAWTTNNVPAGYLECDGASVPASMYPDLYAAIGNTYGGNTSSFNVPDFRGEFLRGWSHGSGKDPDAGGRGDRGDGHGGDNTGTTQSNQIQSHNHSISARDIVGPYGGSQNFWEIGGGGKSTNHTGGSETRPRNVSVMWLIKI